MTPGARVVRTLALCVVSATAAAAFVQPRASPTPQAQLSFPSEVRFVEVSVVVRDRDGKPVTNLTPAEFRIFDGGREQKLASFSMDSSTDAGPGAAAAAAAPPGFFHNLGEPGGVTVILFDRLNTEWQDQAYAKKQIVKFLGGIDAGDRVGLYLLESDRVRVLHEFTSDTASLLSVLEKHRATGSFEKDASEGRVYETGDSEFDDFMRFSNRIVNATFLRRRAELTVDALVGIAHHLAGVRGRKNLIWVSSSFPLTFDDPIGRATPGASTGEVVGNVADDVRRAARALSDAAVAVYPIDARGLLGAFAVNPASLPSTPDSGRTMRDAFATLSTTMPEIDTSRDIAARTGGRAFHSTNDIGGAVRRALDDARSTYLLGYAPDHNDWNGRFRTVKVTTTRPGIEVRHREGYFASKLPEKRPRSGPALVAALRSPLDDARIAVGVLIEKVPDGGPAEAHLAIRIDPRPITLEKRGASWRGKVSLLIAQTSASGRVDKDFDSDIELDLTDDLRARLLTQGIIINKKVSLRDDLHRLHIVVADPPTGVVGSLIVSARQARSALGR